MRLSDYELQELTAALRRMGAMRKAPADGRGIYLGDGVTPCELRSEDLADSLDELGHLRDRLRSLRTLIDDVLGPTYRR